MNALVDISLQTILARSETLLYSDVGADVTMMSIDSGKYYGLSKVGARIWSLLEHPMSAGRVCDQLMTEYRVDRTRCETDVLNVCRRMAEEGVVTVVETQS